MSRYRFTGTKKSILGKQVFKPTMYPTIPLKDTDIFIYPKFGDRLDTLAQKYYGSVSFWWIIAKANNLDTAEIGLATDKKIRIPMEIELIQNRLKNMSY